MAKILLVEDDNNLREIYEARLMAEGYDIVSARDGEEALTVAMKEKPDLIISDVMMPKISGFDMLDILRSTEETKHIKVIMMTALSQAEDKARAEKLGADRYLVKSQVTLEDVAKVAREVIEGTSTPVSPQQTAPTTSSIPETVATSPSPTTMANNDDDAQPSNILTPTADSDGEPVVVSSPSQIPVVTNPTANPTVTATAVPVVEPPTTPAPQMTEEQAIAKQIEATLQQGQGSPSPSPVVQPTFEEPVAQVPQPAPVPEATNNANGVVTPVNPEPVVETPSVEVQPTNSAGEKIINPISNTENKPDLNALLAAEEEKERQSAMTTPAQPAPQTITPTPIVDITPPPTTQQPASTPQSPANSDIDPNSIAL